MIGTFYYFFSLVFSLFNNTYHFHRQYKVFCTEHISEFITKKKGCAKHKTEFITDLVNDGCPKFTQLQHETESFKFHG